jgi:hypothetical protein
MSASKCDRCGEVVADIDAGFSPGLHGMAHDCGGTWIRVPDAPESDDEADARADHEHDKARDDRLTGDR